MKLQIIATGLAMISLTVAVAQDQSQSNVRDYIRSHIQLGSYRDISERFDATATPELIDMLQEDSEQEHWANTAGMLGVVGDERAADALIDLAERPFVGPVCISAAQHNARKEAIRSLGFLVNRTGSEKALQFLIDSLDDGIWRQRNVLGLVSYLDTYEQYDRQLSIYAIFGLALSGNPRAGEALRSLKESPTPQQARLRNDLDDTLDTWLKVYDLVAEKGVAGMYAHFDTQRELEGLQQLEEAQRLREAQGR